MKNGLPEISKSLVKHGFVMIIIAWTAELCISSSIPFTSDDLPKLFSAFVFWDVQLSAMIKLFQPCRNCVLNVFCSKEVRRLSVNLKCL